MTLRIFPRWFDLSVALGLFVALALPMAMVAVAVKLSSAGPVFYRHPRVGLHGQPILVWKFRTMRVGADRQGPAVTSANDQRVTALGRWLRARKIDEWPQLLNVLAGDMAMVGPRPEVAEFVQCYPDRFSAVLQRRPGITDPASLAFADEEKVLANAGERWREFYIQEILPQKLTLAEKYVRERSNWSDLRILTTTLLEVAGRFRKEG